LYCYWRPPRVRESKEYLEKTLKLSVTKQRKAQAINAFGNLYYEMGHYQRALVFYQKALELTKYKSLPFYNMAFTYEKLEDKKTAVAMATNSIREMKSETELKHSTDPTKTLRQLIGRCRK
jgi:tetratricopeptide (TPR) repeat protein